MRAYRVPVLIDREQYDAYQEYAESLDVPTAGVIREALSSHFERIIIAKIQALALKQSRALAMSIQKGTPDA